MLNLRTFNSYSHSLPPSIPLPLYATKEWERASLWIKKKASAVSTLTVSLRRMELCDTSQNKEFLQCSLDYILLSLSTESMIQLLFHYECHHSCTNIREKTRIFSCDSSIFTSHVSDLNFLVSYPNNLSLISASFSCGISTSGFQMLDLSQILIRLQLFRKRVIICPQQ